MGKDFELPPVTAVIIQVGFTATLSLCRSVGGLGLLISFLLLALTSVLLSRAHSYYMADRLEGLC